MTLPKGWVSGQDTVVYRGYAVCSAGRFNRIINSLWLAGATNSGGVRRDRGGDFA